MSARKRRRSSIAPDRHPCQLARIVFAVNPDVIAATRKGIMLQACLNGNRDKAFHPALPCTADELARDAKEAVAEGAEALHVHPRDGAGRESVHPDDIAAALRAIRASVPGIPVGV